MGSVDLRGLTKVFSGGVAAVDGVDLEIAEGEFFALLGPSGCGKTTTMRCIAGFEAPTSGEVRIAGIDVGSVPPHRRNTGMVFQSYALFPHYDVFRNVAYGLVMRDLYTGTGGTRARAAAALFSGRAARRSADIRAKVDEALDQVGLTGYQDRAITALSGGQQQRVALARALVRRPAVLLMDEPLSNLDKNLRIQMRATIRTIQRDVGITTVLVTHDQEEAMGMADRVALMRDGRLVQVDTPTGLYERPADAWAARFVGSSNILEGTVEDAAGGAAVRVGGTRLRTAALDRPAGASVRLLIRPEAIEVLPPGRTPAAGANLLPGTVARRSYLGPAVVYDVDAAGAQIAVEDTFRGAGALLAEGDEVRLAVAPERIVAIAGDAPPDTAGSTAGPDADRSRADRGEGQ